MTVFFPKFFAHVFPADQAVGLQGAPGKKEFGLHVLGICFQDVGCGLEENDPFVPQLLVRLLNAAGNRGKDNPAVHHDPLILDEVFKSPCSDRRLHLVVPRMKS